MPNRRQDSRFRPDPNSRRERAIPPIENRKPKTENPPVDPKAAITAALARRKPLLNDENTNAIRIINGPADQLDGLVIEKFGDVLIAQLHEGRLALP